MTNWLMDKLTLCKCSGRQSKILKSSKVFLLIGVTDKIVHQMVTRLHWIHIPGHFEDASFRYFFIGI